MSSKSPPTSLPQLEPVASSRKKRSSGGNTGVLISIVLSFSLFLSLLQLFDPTAVPQKQKANSAVERGLHGFFDYGENGNANLTSEEPSDDPIHQLLREAGVYDSMSAKQRANLPTWKHVVDLYGDQVRIIGKERCEAYRQKVKRRNRIVAVAGLFNTGTNALHIHLERNILGVLEAWQVPWGKHRMAEVKWRNTAPFMDTYPKEDVLPVVIVRDPLAWLQSMCRSYYVVHWLHDEHHCPNFIPTDLDRELYGEYVQDTFPVRVRFDPTSEYRFDSMAHFWSQWHYQYLDADYPVLFVRFEDLIFQPRVVLSQIADCLGAELRDPLYFQTESSKIHGSGSDFVNVIIKTADSSHRLQNLTMEDRVYAAEHFDPYLMEIFRYLSPLANVSSS